MRYVLWTILGIFVIFILGFLHYTLPQRDIVRIVNTEVQRVDVGANSWFWASPDVGSDGTTVNRDVRFIETFYENGNPMVFRNEDTGWWPPYLKFDSADLQAEARDQVSTQAAPTWVEVRHYGWRNEWFSIFPNALSVKAVEGPDHRSIPWFNIIFFVLLAAVLFYLWRVWRRFQKRRIEPLVDDIEEASEEARGRLRGLWRRITGR
ncbi:MAG: DUF1523 family protein [Pseudomonadota bacterium]